VNQRVDDNGIAEIVKFKFTPIEADVVPRGRKRTRRQISDTDVEPSDSGNSDYEISRRKPQTTGDVTTTKTDKKLSNKKQSPWDPKHLQLLRDTFKNLEKPPNAKTIRELQEREPSLKCRSIAQIKTRAWAMMCSKK
jgi:hypothetical protein